MFSYYTYLVSFCKSPVVYLYIINICLIINTPSDKLYVSQWGENKKQIYKMLTF